jgi:hypothetical protein
MALENVRVTEETLNLNDPRAMECEIAPDFALHHFRWYVVGSNEPVAFASKDEARRYLTERYRVGDFVEINSGWPKFGYITDIDDDSVRVEAPNRTWSWRLDRATFSDYVLTWRRR